MATAEIRLWSIDINAASHEPEALLSLLSDDELKRAARFRVEKHRRRWIAGRAMLRTILSSMTRRSPESLVFEYNEHAKPYLPRSSCHERIHFNLTHSSDLALLAVTSVGPVGIDVERIKPLSNIDAVVNRFFSPAEQEAFCNVRGDMERLKAFYTCWTRKEAYLKALGCGISAPTDTFDVTFLSNSKPEIIAINGGNDAAREWLLFDLQVTPGYVGALAIRSIEKIALVWPEQMMC